MSERKLPGSSADAGELTRPKKESARELPERFWFLRRRNRMKSLFYSWTVFQMLVGIWLFISPFVFGYAETHLLQTTCSLEPLWSSSQSERSSTRYTTRRGSKGNRRGNGTCQREGVSHSFHEPAGTDSPGLIRLTKPSSLGSKVFFILIRRDPRP